MPLPPSMKKPKTDLVKIDAIRTDLGTQARSKIDQETVQLYAAAMRKFAPFPRILLFRDKAVDGYILIDGRHRLDAHKLVHSDLPVSADVVNGTLEEARWFSYAMNANHGLKRTNADKNRAARLALQHPMGEGKSNCEIADHVGVDEKLIRRVREELESTSALPKSAKRVGRDGRAICTEKIGRNSGKNAEIVASDSEVALPNVVPMELTDERKTDKEDSPVPTPSASVQQSDGTHSNESLSAKITEQGSESPDRNTVSPCEQRLMSWLPLKKDRDKGVQGDNIIHVPLSDSDRLVACLFESFDPQFREKVLDTLIRTMLVNDGKESVLKVIAPLYDESHRS
ncbi:MAG: hypothetical protein FWC43_08575 [Planctomycetaceae bacterium]|nr:hypothetical protein [Planctomycetaceae bacterium]